jgi:hypothetical protein
MKGVLPLLVHLSLCAGKRDFCPVSATLVGPVQNIFFLTVHYFTSFVPIAQQAGQAVVPRRLSINMCLWVLCSDKNSVNGSGTEKRTK